ncbi:MAG: hypothetical protein FJ109_22080, partial [Deltaproteobacteria bacterium]|nr:hypothetical protein [Deltaproteobacteria bacterium]
MPPPDLPHPSTPLGAGRGEAVVSGAGENMGEGWKFFATVPRGLEGALAEELRGLGIADAAEARAGVSFSGGLEHGYRACIWSRCASRVLVELARVPAADDEALYAGVRTVDWSEHMTVRQTFAVSFSSSRSTITHTNYGALKVKDAIADWFRDRGGERPSVDRERPHVRVQVHVEGEQAVVALDLSGESLHRRAWRREAGPASLKENLAAGILRLSEWPATVAAGGGFLDPMCGGGTLVIEAALAACDTAPGLLRSSFGFQRWRLHDDSLFRRLVQEARERDARNRAELPPIAGFDNDPALVRAATRNAASAGVARHVRFERRELALVEPVGDIPGIVVVNPPYGERLGQTKGLLLLYQRIGMTLKHRFPEWTGYVFTGNMDAAKKLGLRVARRYPLYNGAIECRLLKIPVLKERSQGSHSPDHAGGALGAPADAAGSGVGDQESHSPDHAGGALEAPADAAGSGVGDQGSHSPDHAGGALGAPADAG